MQFGAAILELFLKCSPYGDRGGPLALQQSARQFPHFGLGRLATNTRHQELLPDYKEIKGSKILAEFLSLFISKLVQFLPSRQAP